MSRDIVFLWMVTTLSLVVAFLVGVALTGGATDTLFGDDDHLGDDLSLDGEDL